MKKINPNNDVCDSYRLDEKDFGKALRKGVQISKRCHSCFYNLFAICWLEESEKKNFQVNRALEGNEQAKLNLHKKLEEDEKI